MTRPTRPAPPAPDVPIARETRPGPPQEGEHYHHGKEWITPIRGIAVVPASRTKHWLALAFASGVAAATVVVLVLEETLTH